MTPEVFRILARLQEQSRVERNVDMEGENMDYAEGYRDGLDEAIAMILEMSVPQ